MFGLTPFERKSYDLFNAFHDFEDDFFGGNKMMNNMKIDIRDKKNEYLLEAELPGFKKEDIKLDINGDYLVLTAEHNEEKNEKDDDGKYICRERSYGSFQRSFNISNVDVDRIDAEYNDGVLKLVLPKKEEEVPQTRRLEIK